MRPAYLAGVLLFVSSPLWAAISIRADKVIGNWYSEGRYPYGMIYSIRHIAPDGSFENEFRECFSTGGSKDHVESGHWTIDGNRFRTITEFIAQKPVHLTIETETISFDDVSWTELIVGGDGLKSFGRTKARSTRVSADSKLPACEPVS
ncbi:MAG TPA: hypothetical protein VGM17_15755 [Rhizomicrobium sp.]